MLITEYESISHPKAIIVYYDKVSESYFIRLVDSLYNTIKSVSALPALCSISDLCVEIIKVRSVISKDQCITINNKYMFEDIGSDVVFSVLSGNKKHTALKLIRKLFKYCVVDNDTTEIKVCL